MKKLLAASAVLLTAGATGCFGAGSALADDGARAKPADARAVDIQERHTPWAARTCWESRMTSTSVVPARTGSPA